MNKEHKIIISFVFNRSGKREMSFSEFYLTLSLDLKWFTPDNAKSFTLNSIEYKCFIVLRPVMREKFNQRGYFLPCADDTTSTLPFKQMLYIRIYKD